MFRAELPAARGVLRQNENRVQGLSNSPIDAVAKEQAASRGRSIAILRGCGRRLAKFLITTPFFSITKAGGLLPVFHAVTVSRTCTTRRCPRAGRYCQPRLSRLNSTATKSSRRRSRSERSHLLRSRSPRQSRALSRRAIACVARYGGPIQISLIRAKSSKPAIRSQAICFASLTTGNASWALKRYSRAMMPRQRREKSCAKSTESTSRFTIGSAIAITSSNEDCFRLP